MKKREFPKLKKVLIPLFIVLVLILTLYSLGIFKKVCFTESCFQEALTKCSPAEFVKQKNNNLYVYSLYPSVEDKCSVKIKLERLAPGSDPELIKLLEGKSMFCKIPKNILKQTNLDNLDNILQYCHGELKEGILELIIQRMYTLIIGDLDEIVQKSKDFLQEV